MELVIEHPQADLRQNRFTIVRTEQGYWLVRFELMAGGLR